MAPVLALADELAHERGARLAARGAATARERLLLSDRRALVDERGEELVLGAVRAEQANGRRRGLVGCGLVEPEPRGRGRGRLAPLAEVLDPAAAAVGARHARDEARHDRLQLLEQHLAVRARLGERVREQVQHELLVRLAARVDPDVRERRRREDAADEVERLRPHGAPVRRRRLSLRRAGTSRPPTPRRPRAAREYVAKSSSIAASYAGPKRGSRW